MIVCVGGLGGGGGKKERVVGVVVCFVASPAHEQIQYHKQQEGAHNLIRCEIFIVYHITLFGLQCHTSLRSAERKPV